jgi:hypothetical protein
MARDLLGSGPDPVERPGPSEEAVMANQPKAQDPADVADERGKIAPSELPGDELSIPEAPSDTTDAGSTETPGEAIEPLADPDADANFPDPSKPISMGVGGADASAGRR